ncbi:hypothetical protein [Fibrella forsythiae]|uniref:Uncharacterized protein n=1 Tax=Fibrella forsythiae TaxID=2817061 RepID=A0ABS3JV91_9BACT|nr:hypothetical protein [Fibrella forsythiae]MBO0953311.1 hypothetical protein [Fibrella forsythiae]
MSQSDSPRTFSQALSALSAQHGHSQFVHASLEPATGQVVIQRSPGVLSPAMQILYQGCLFARDTYREEEPEHDPFADEPEEDYGDDPYDGD